MNEQLQQAVSALITQSLSLFNQGVSFLSTELPDAVQQLLMWKATESFISMLFSLCLLIGWILLDIKCFKVIKNMKGIWERDDPGWFLYFGVGSFVRLFLIWIICAFASITWLQIWIAPKVYLIEYAAKFLK